MHDDPVTRRPREGASPELFDLRTLLEDMADLANDRADRYRARADRLEAAATRALDAGVQRTYLELAQHWRDLVATIERAHTRVK